MIHSSLEQASKKLPLTIEWRAFELQPQEAAPMDPVALAEKQERIDSFWPTVEKIAREQYSLELKQTRLGVDTRLAHVGAKVARDLGKGDAYHPKVFEAHWVKRQDISDSSVLVEIAREIGLDADAFRQGLSDMERQAEVLGEELGAQQIGVRGVPAIVIDNRYLLSGAQPAERLIALLEEYQERGELG